MSIVHDNSDSLFSSTNANLYTLSNFTLGGGSDRMVLVGINGSDNNSISTDYVRFNGVDMHLAKEIITGTGDPYGYASVWYLLESELPVAGNYDIAVYFHGYMRRGAILATSLEGVMQHAPFQVESTIENGAYGSIDTDITSMLNGCWAFDNAYLQYETTLTPDSGQTTRNNGGFEGSTAATSTQPFTSEGTKNLGWTAGDTANMGHVVVCIAPAGEPYTGWGEEQEIELDTTSGGADVSNTVTDFPVLLRLTNSDVDFSKILAGGADIRFMNGDKNLILPYEIDEWDDTGETAAVWVLVPTITGNSTTTIYMKYDKSGSTDLSDGGKVFDSENGFYGVFHLKEQGDGTTGEYKDSSDMGYDATGKASHYPDKVDALIEHGQDFDNNSGDGDLITSLDDDDTRGTHDYGYSVWVKADTLLPRYTYVLTRPSWFLLQLYASNDATYPNRLQFITQESGTTYYDFATFAMTAGTWYHIYVTFDDSIDRKRLYINGVEDASSPWDNPSYIYEDLLIGGVNGTGQSIDGKYDEVRQEIGVVRSADWVKLSYENQQENDSLVTFISNNVDILKVINRGINRGIRKGVMS